MLHMNLLLHKLVTHKVEVHLKVFGLTMQHWIRCKKDCPLIVIEDCWLGGVGYVHF